MLTVIIEIIIVIIIIIPVIFEEIKYDYGEININLPKKKWQHDGNTEYLEASEFYTMNCELTGNGTEFIHMNWLRCWHILYYNKLPMSLVQFGCLVPHPLCLTHSLELKHLLFHDTSWSKHWVWTPSVMPQTLCQVTLELCVPPEVFALHKENKLCKTWDCQQQCWRKFRSFVMWWCVVGWVAPSV